MSGAVRDLKNAMGSMFEIMKEQGEALNSIQEQLSIISTKKRATEMIAEDSRLIGLKWNELQDIKQGLRTLECEEACARLLLSERIWDLKSRYMAAMLELFLTKDFFGRMYWATPVG